MGLWIALASRGAVISTCHWRAPMPGQLEAHGLLEVGRVGGGRLPQHAAQVVGGQEVLDRHVVLLGEGGDQRACRGETRRRDRVTLGPDPGRRRAVVTDGQRRELVVGQLPGAVDGRQPAVGVAAGTTTVEAGRVEQTGRVGRHRVGGGDQRRVGDEPPGRGVAACGDLVTGLPQLADRRERAAALGLVDARRTAPRVRPRRWHVVDEVLELLVGPLGLAAVLELAADHVAQLDEHLDVEGGVLQPGPGQRTPGPVHRRVLLAHRLARGSPRPGWPGRRGGSPAAAQRARCRRAGRA